jgi:hypothetical protein
MPGWCEGLHLLHRVALSGTIPFRTRRHAGRGAEALPGLFARAGFGLRACVPIEAATHKSSSRA